MKKLLLVDLDDTLLSFHKASIDGLNNIAKQYGLVFSNEDISTYEEINNYYWRQVESSLMDRDTILSLRFHDFLQKYGIDTDGTNENEIYFKTLAEVIYYVDGAIEFLQKAKEKGLIICLVSNGVKSLQDKRLALSEIPQFISKRYISDEIGYPKPNINFFLPILKDFPSISKDEMMIIGDSLSSDIQGGINFGITTIWFNPHSKSSDKPDYQINKLSDFFLLDFIK